MNLTEPQAGSDLSAVRTQARARGRPLPHPRHEDLHHLGRARHDGEHRPSRARAHAGRARRREGHLALHRAEVSCVRPDGTPRRAQRRQVRLDRAQDGHPCEPDLRARVRRGQGRDRLSRRRAESRPRVHVHHDEPRATRCRHRGHGHRGACLPACAGIRADARAGSRDRTAQRRSRHDHSSSRRETHADRA